MQVIKEYDTQYIRRAFKLWRLNCGLSQKMYENQERTLVLAKSAQKFYMKSLNHVKLQYYQKWKRIALDKGDAHHKMKAAFSEMLTESVNFNRCVENDYYLSVILKEKIIELIKGVAFSELFLNQNENQSLKVFCHESGEQINYFIQSLFGNSLLGHAIQQGQTVFVSDSKNTIFNRDIDCPINYKPDKSIKNMTIVHILLQDIGVLRLYLTANVTRATY